MKFLPDSSKKVLGQVEQATIVIPEQNSCNWKHKSLISVLFGSLTIGLLWQIYGISFLQLTASSTVFIETKVGTTYKKLPALTFCANIGYSAVGNTSEEFFKTVKIQDYIEYITVSSNYGGKDIDYTYMISDPVETISYKYYCFTINTALKGYQMEIKDDQILWIKLKHMGIFDVWWLTMHNSYDMPSSYEWNARRIKKGSYLAMGYNHESYEQMANTFPGICSNYYLNSEYTSRKDCIRKCKLRESLRKCGVVYNGIDVKKGEESVKFADTWEEKKCVNDMLEFGDDCSRKCHNTDCRTDSYKPFIIMKNLNYWDYSVLQVIPPNSPEPEYKQRPSVDTGVYFYYLSGNISIWLGFALYLLYNKCSKKIVPKAEVQVYGNTSKVEQAVDPMKAPK